MTKKKDVEIVYGLEIDPGYCDVIIRRYAEFKEIDVEEIYATAQV